MSPWFYLHVLNTVWVHLQACSSTHQNSLAPSLGSPPCAYYTVRDQVMQGGVSACTLWVKHGGMGQRRDGKLAGKTKTHHGDYFWSLQKPQIPSPWWLPLHEPLPPSLLSPAGPDHEESPK